MGLRFPNVGDDVGDVEGDLVGHLEGELLVGFVEGLALLGQFVDGVEVG